MWIPFAVGVGVGVLAGGHSPKRAATLSGLTLGSTAILRSISWRAAGSGALFGARALGAMTIQGFGGAVLGGALVGTGVSYLMFGEQGAKAAVDFYTDPFDKEKGKKILDIPKNVAARSSYNRAVEGNAMGIETGTPIDPSTGAPRRHSRPDLYSPVTGELQENWISHL